MDYRWCCHRSLYQQIGVEIHYDVVVPVRAALPPAVWSFRMQFFQPSCLAWWIFTRFHLPSPAPCSLLPILGHRDQRLTLPLGTLVLAEQQDAFHNVCFPDGSSLSESAVLICWGKHGCPGVCFACASVGGADWRRLRAPGWLVSWVAEVVFPAVNTSGGGDSLPFWVADDIWSCCALVGTVGMSWFLDLLAWECSCEASGSLKCMLLYFFLLMRNHLGFSCS